MPSPAIVVIVAFGRWVALGGLVFCCSAEAYPSIAANVALPSPLARPFGVYAWTWTFSSR